jgi:hypothetical protein
MAERKASENENSRPASADANKPDSKGMGLVEGAILAAVSIGAKLWNAVTADGVLAAAGRQGIDELGAALKAFPDAMQVQETGTLWNPTQGEIAADRKQGKHIGSYSSYSSSSGPPHPWPSEIAKANQHQPGNDHGNGHDNGHDAGHSM